MNIKNVGDFSQTFGNNLFFPDKKKSFKKMSITTTKKSMPGNIHFKIQWLHSGFPWTVRALYIFVQFISGLLHQDPCLKNNNFKLKAQWQKFNLSVFFYFFHSVNVDAHQMRVGLHLSSRKLVKPEPRSPASVWGGMFSQLFMLPLSSCNCPSRGIHLIKEQLTIFS